MFLFVSLISSAGYLSPNQGNTVLPLILDLFCVFWL